MTLTPLPVLGHSQSDLLRRPHYMLRRLPQIQPLMHRLRLPQLPAHRELVVYMYPLVPHIQGSLHADLSTAMNA